jgi:beta-lactamase superfamily II metal-dependent hydrolase
VFQRGARGALVLVLLCAAPAATQTIPIFQIDVEQAALFVLPSGKTLLVDSGKNGHGSRVHAVMKDAGVTQIDAFVTTHYHEDHFGGIDDLVLKAKVQVLEAYDRGDKEFLPKAKLNEPTYKAYQNTVREDAIHLTRGMSIALDPDVTITCISSSGVVIGENPPQPGKAENDMSMSLLITFRGFRYFVGGDIETFTEEKIAQRDLVKDVDLYEANHHGSHTSSSPALMGDLNPTVVVISNGSVSRYKHPRATTLKTYAKVPGPPVVCCKPTSAFTLIRAGMWQTSSSPIPIPVTTTEPFE